MTTQLRSTEAELPAIDLQRARVLHALATLCGRPATSFSNARPAPSPTPFRMLPVWITQ